MQIYQGAAFALGAVGILMIFGGLTLEDQLMTWGLLAFSGGLVAFILCNIWKRLNGIHMTLERSAPAPVAQAAPPVDDSLEHDPSGKPA